MKISRYPWWLLSVTLALTSLCSADTGTIAGNVRDEDGKPLSGARIQLTGQQAPPSTYAAMSGSSGEYRFTSLDAGDYVVTVDLPGYVAPAPMTVRVSSGAPSATADLKLTRAPHPKLEFESSGIRGLIDPGGYSASAAGAATGLLRGIADVKRTGKRYDESMAKDWPCTLEAELRQAVEKSPQSGEANRKLGQFYAAHDEPAKAIPPLRRALEIDARDSVASRELAIALMQNGDFEHARELLSTLADLPSGHPAQPEVHQLLARADEGLGQFQQAAQQYRIAAEEEPSEESLFGLGYELVLAGSLDQGLDTFDAGVQKYPRSIALRIGLGTAQFFKGKTLEAVRSFLDATDIDPVDSRPYSFLAVTLGLAKEESVRVRSSFQRFLDRSPDNASANYFYALALSLETTASDGSRIESLLRRAIQLDPRLARAHLLLADTLAARKDDEDAAPEYETAIRLDHDLNEAHYRLAQAYKHIGKADLSAREIQIFRLSKQSKSIGAEGIDISQFVSVMDAADGHSSQELQCPAASH